MPDFPHWWDWDFDLSHHMLRRMVDRGLAEPDLRLMLEDSATMRIDTEPGRFVISARLRGQSWEIIVEPDPHISVVVVITAYAVE